jgi:hypothetical protein
MGEQLNVKVSSLKLKKMMLTALLAVGFIAPASAEEARSPVGKLMDPNGAVEYSRDGEKWRPVTRAKYLFSGYHIRTGADGSGNFINQESGLAQSLSANVAAMVGDTGLEVSAGEVSDPFSSDAGLMDGLANKFASAQRYTTVRRAVKKPGEPECEVKVRLAREITVSEGFADLVWDKACPDNTFVIVLGEQQFEVPADASGEHIRFQLPVPDAGEYALRLDVKAGEEVVYTPRRPGKLKVLAAGEEATIKASIVAAGDDFFAQADVLEQHGLLVPAMDAYRAYFDVYPDDIEMKPLFIANLQALQLMKEKTAEAQKYDDFISE